MSKETEYAWAAGIIDGEGYIGMTKNKPGVNRRITISFQIRISVRMTHRDTIEKLHSLFGGTFKVCNLRNKTKWKCCYEWYAGDKCTINVLTLVLPYLVTKKSQAELVLDYRKQCFLTKPKGQNQCSPEITNLRFEYFKRLSELNKKGP